MVAQSEATGGVPSGSTRTAAHRASQMVDARALPRARVTGRRSAFPAAASGWDLPTSNPRRAGARGRDQRVCDPAPARHRGTVRALRPRDGYITVAGRPLNPADYRTPTRRCWSRARPSFTQAGGPVPLEDATIWWAYVPGASWRHPWGPNSDNTQRADHPVTHVAYEDAQAYAGWSGLASAAERG
jgi:Sulfatase-modifying factor enzyme 1